MVRVVGGDARGRRLAVPAHGTRPTSDRARESLFNTLLTYIELTDARVLELFAGSGAVGIEALSRGASQVTFVDSARPAVATITANLRAVGLTGGLVRCATAASYLRSAPADPYDVVFLDPPYALPDDDLRALLAQLVEHQWVRLGGLVVVERAAGQPLEFAEPIETLKQRRYGSAALWYGRRR